MQMDKQETSPLIEEVRASIADVTIGFLRISLNSGEEDANPAGSGALVSVGSIHGVLTAAHVLSHLPDTGEVGIVRFPKVQAFALRQTIDMTAAEKVNLAGSEWGPDGPDLAFLRLSPKDVAALKSTNVFFNLTKRRDAVLGGDRPAKKYFDGISGMIADWASELPPQNRFARVKNFGALYGIGCVVGERESGGFDLLDFEVTYGPNSTTPERYGGMSGGALWRVYVSETNGQQVVAKGVFGVAFYQSGIINERQTITCHGPKSVYGNLVDAIQRRWPTLDG